MRRVLPFPLASCGVLVLWLLLNQTLSPGHLLLGMVIGLVAGWSLLALGLPPGHPRRAGVMVILVALVVVDVIRSNIAVGAIILGFKKTTYTSGFVQIPLELRDHYGLATLSCIITSTPGTLWVGFNPASGILTIHVLDLVDRSLWIKTIKERYEVRLREIFE